MALVNLGLINFPNQKKNAEVPLETPAGQRNKVATNARIIQHGISKFGAN